MNIKTKRILLTVYFFFIFVFISGFSYKTPFMDEDLDLTLNSFNAIIYGSISDYFNWNGRFWGQTFSRLLASSGQLISSIVAGVLFIILIMLISKLAGAYGRNEIFLSKIILITAFLIVVVPDFGSVYIWRAGVGNYLVMGIIELLYLFWFFKDDMGSKSLYVCISVILAFIAGWGNENTSGAVLLITLLNLLIDYIKNRRIQWDKCPGVVANLLGLIILVFSPGDHARMVTTHPDYLKESLFNRAVAGLSRICHYILSNHLLVIFIIFVVLAYLSSVFLYYYRGIKDNTRLLKSGTFIISGLAGIFVMILSPEGMDTGRTYFGPVVLLIIGLMLLIPDVTKNRRTQGILISCTSIFIIFTSCTAYRGIKEAMIFNDQLSERYHTIKAEKAKGVKIVYLDPLYVPSSKFSVIGSYYELSSDPKVFPNAAYQRFYGVKVLPKNMEKNKNGEVSR